MRKSLLPTYDVFDEWRYFEPATEVAPVVFRGRSLGISICEDIWNDADFWPRAALPRRSDRGAGAAPAPRSSSTSRPRPSPSRSATCARACWRRPRGAGAARCCSSTRSAARTTWCSTGPAWRSTPPARWSRARPSTRAISSWSTSTPTRRSRRAPAISDRSNPRTSGRRWGRWCWARATTPAAAAFRARCSGFRAASIRRWWPASPRAPSGPANVLGVAMPSRYSSPGLAGRRRGAGQEPGHRLHASSRSSRCSPPTSRRWRRRWIAFAGRAAQAAEAAADLTEQNLQARIRGAILMALSNRRIGCCSPPATRARSPPATARSTATWRAAWR